LSTDLKTLFKNAFGNRKDSLVKERDKDDTPVTLFEKIDSYNGFSINSNETPPNNPVELEYETEVEEVSIDDYLQDDQLGDLVKTIQKEKTTLARNSYFDNLLSTIEYIYTNEAELDRFIKEAQKDITSFDLSKLDLSKITDKSSIEKEINKYVDSKISNW
jgi:hypothetical protein